MRCARSGHKPLTELDIRQLLERCISADEEKDTGQSLCGLGHLFGEIIRRSQVERLSANGVSTRTLAHRHRWMFRCLIADRQRPLTVKHVISLLDRTLGDS